MAKRYGRVTARAPQMSLQQLRWGKRSLTPQTRAAQRKAQRKPPGEEGPTVVVDMGENGTEPRHSQGVPMEEKGTRAFNEQSQQFVSSTYLINENPMNSSAHMKAGTP
jgi:hypothetical protein